MQQIVLDLGLAAVPTLAGFRAGPNAAALAHLQACVAGDSACGGAAAVPTYLWGESGSGKTHMLRAVRESLRERGASVGWLDPDGAADQPFDDSWAAVLIDDVHHFDPAQQHTAFNWFVNALTPADARPRWVLAAGTLPPADLALREDLRTRLGWGQVFHLQTPDEAERRAVLREAAEARGVHLGDEVVDFMLNRFSRDLGSLMQLLDQLDRYALRTQRAITIPLIKSMLEND